MERKATVYLTKEKIVAYESAPVMIKKRQLAEQIFNSSQYKAHARKKKLDKMRKLDLVAQVKVSGVVSIANQKRKSPTSAKKGKSQAAK